MKHNDIRNWISSQRPRTFFWGSDVPGSIPAVESALSRMANDPASPIIRVRQGLYWVKPKATKFGFGRPDPMAAALVAAGPGSGPAGWSASQALGLSTQLPATPLIAVPGRPPKGLAGVDFVGRSNLSRCDLNQSEIAVLEVMRDFPDFTDRSKTWADAATQIHNQIVMGRVDRNRLLTCARNERNRRVRDRAQQLMEV